MTNEEFEAHCAELEKQSVVGKWKNAYEALVDCYLAVAYKRKWKHYDPEFDYKDYARELIESQGYIYAFQDVKGETPLEEWFTERKEE
jgi:hypothetical protein